MSVGFDRGSSFSPYDLASGGNDLILRESIDNAWDETKDHAMTSVTFERFSQMNNKNSAEGDQAEWAIGDYPAESTSLGGNVTTASTTVDLGENRFFSGDVFSVKNDSANYALFRIGSRTSGSTYAIDKMLDGAGTVSATETAFLHGSAVNYDGEARDFLNTYPDSAKQFMQRLRETVGMGMQEQAQSFIGVHNEEDQVRKAFRSFSRKVNNAIHRNDVAAGRNTSGDGWGLFGGLPYYFNPSDKSFSESGGIRTVAANGYAGKNRVDTGTSLDLFNLFEWTENLAEYGSKSRLVFLSPLMYNLVFELMRAEFGIQRGNYSDINPMFQDIQSVPKIETGYLDLYFHVDRGLTGVQQFILDDTKTTRKASNLYWMVAVDPMGIGMPKRIVPKLGGAQDVRIREVEKERNSSIEEHEIDMTAALYINDPRTGGYYGITNS